MDDIAIFVDSLKGINAIKEKGFSVDGIIEVNKQFDSPSDEQPILPGHLRNSYYNEDDRIAIVIDQASQEYYVPKEIITRGDLQEIVDQFNVREIFLIVLSLSPTRQRIPLVTGILSHRIVPFFPPKYKKASPNRIG